VAHELRAPISALVAGSEILADRLESIDPEQLREMVSVIHRGTLWMQGIVENLLCASSINAGRFYLQRHWVEPLEMIAEVQPVVAPMLSKKQQVLRTSSRGVRRSVWADGRRMGQVLVNLISNASKFTPPGEPIDLFVYSRPDYLRVTVADRGPGLAPGTASRLFEPFFRAAQTEGLSQEGMGLGLSIVKSIVESHGGRVGARNRRGGGARFWFELRFEPQFEPARRGPAVAWSTVQGGKR
jgi:two-component system sensor histidine kinase KdpD